MISLAMLRRPLLFILLAGLASLTACGDKDDDNPLSDISVDPYVTVVRTGHFNNYPSPNPNIGTVFDRYFGSPRWESLVGTDGNRYVNVTGGMTYAGDPITALVQFRVNVEEGTFVINALEFNSIPQNQATINALIADIYDEVGS